MALDKFQPYLFVSAGEQSNKYLTPTYADGIAHFQAQRVQSLTGLTVRIDAIQEGAGDPSPSNIRPISGRTGLTVTRAGKNLLPYPYANGTTTLNGVTFTVNSDGTINVNGTATANTNFILGVSVASGNYIFSGCPSGGSDSKYYLAAQANGTWSNRDYGSGKAINGAITNAAISVMNGCVCNNLEFKPMVRVTGKNDTYEPYTANTYPVTWSTEAGTVYGGTLNVTTGVLTVNRFFKAFDGTEDWARTGSIGANTNRYYIQWGNMGITGNVINLSDSMCSHLVFLSGNVGQFGTFNASTTNFAVKDGDGTQFADMAAFKAWLAAQNTNGTPLQLCVELATPQTYQLTPTEIKTLAGFNQIYSDAGPVIDIQF